MTNSRLAISAAALGLASGLTLGGLSAFAGGDKVVFPDNWDKGVLYNTGDRYDVKQYRELWSTPSAVEAARKGEPIPSGTVLTLVQYKAQLDAARRQVYAYVALGVVVVALGARYPVLPRQAHAGAGPPDDP